MRISNSGGKLLGTLFPRVADNSYLGLRAGVWLFALMPVKIAMGINVMFNAASVAQSADGIPLQSFSANASSAFLFIFAAWGLCQLVLGLASLVVLLRYRSLVPLAFLALLLEQLGRKLLHIRWPIEHLGNSPGNYINTALLSIMSLGFLLSLWRPSASSA